MARLVAGILILLAAPALAATTTDVAGDVTPSIGAAPVDEPSVDILWIRGEHANGTLALTLHVAGPVPTTTGDASRQHSHLFLVAYNAPEGQPIYQQVVDGRDAIGVVCRFDEGQANLGCEMSVGDAVLRGVGVEGHNLTVRIATERADPFAVGASSSITISNATRETGREVIAQDFTDNALPYQSRPPDDAPAASPAQTTRPWYLHPLAWFTGGLFVVALLLYIRKR